jgi:hypothetical protein
VVRVMSILDPRAVVVEGHLGDLTIDDLLPEYNYRETRTTTRGSRRRLDLQRRLEEIRGQR